MPVKTVFVLNFNDSTEKSIGRKKLRLLKSKALLALCATALLAVGCSKHEEKVFKVTAIPDESPTELARKAEPLMNYLSEKLDMKVEYTPVTDYAASVEALANKQVDMAWFGGFTFIQAKVRSNDQVEPIIQRAEDETFKSVFITTKEDIQSLADLKGKSVSFGSQSSTSGHLMPRSFLAEAGLNPEADFERVAFSGAHDATIAAVEAGKVDAGALNIKVWEKFVADNKVDTAKVRVFYTTPSYYDYNWTIRKDLDPEVRTKLIDAFLALSPDSEPGKTILGLQRASKFVTTKAENYAGIESAAKEAGLLK